jgi:hypothetical protein
MGGQRAFLVSTVPVGVRYGGNLLLTQRFGMTLPPRKETLTMPPLKVKAMGTQSDIK